MLPALSSDGCDIGSWLESEPDCGDRMGLPKRPLAVDAKPDPADPEPPIRYKSSGADDARRILDSGAGGPSAEADGVSSPPPLPADDKPSWSLSDTIGSALTPARAALRGDRRTEDEVGDAGPPLALAFAFACSCFLLERSGTMAEAEAEAAAAAAAEAVTMADAGRREPNETRRMCAADDEPAASIMAWY